MASVIVTVEPTALVAGANQETLSIAALSDGGDGPRAVLACGLGALRNVRPRYYVRAVVWGGTKALVTYMRKVVTPMAARMAHGIQPPTWPFKGPDEMREPSISHLTCICQKKGASKDGRARVQLWWCGVDCIRVEAHQRPGNPRVRERLAVRRHRRSVASLGLAIREVREAEKPDAKGLGELLPTRGRTRIVLQ